MNEDKVIRERGKLHAVVRIILRGMSKEDLSDESVGKIEDYMFSLDEIQIRQMKIEVLGLDITAL